MRIYSIPIIALILSVDLNFSNAQGRNCYLPSFELGICVVLTQCPQLATIFGAGGGSPEAVQYILAAQRSCGTRSIHGDPIVCCSRPVIFAESGTTERTRTTTTKSTTTTTTSRSTGPSKPIQTAEPGENCQDPNGQEGVCKTVRNCKSILEEYKTKRGDQEYIKYLKKSNEICSYEPTNVCCPKD